MAALLVYIRMYRYVFQKLELISCEFNQVNRAALSTIRQYHPAQKEVWIYSIMSLKMVRCQELSNNVSTKLANVASIVAS